MFLPHVTTAAPTAETASNGIVEREADTVTIESIDTLQPIVGTGRRGDFVHNSQTMATDRGFRNVSEKWASKADNETDSEVMTFDQAFEYVERERGSVHDITCEYGRFQPVLRGNHVLIADTETGEEYQFSESSRDQYSERTHVGATLPRRLADEPDRRDGETLLACYENGLRRIADRGAFVRTRNANGDKTVRAFLSDQYQPIDNRWFLEVLQRIVPGGLVSHFAPTDGCDSIYFNLLIPDTIRKETDSDYGGMLACGNSEIGRRKLKSLPSVFRAICQNGCIWDQVDGVEFVNRVHRGEIDLDVLESAIRENLNRQIPLLGNGVDQMLQTKQLTTKTAGNLVIASTLKSLSVPGLTKTTADRIVESFDEQRALIDAGSTVSAFDVIQGVTAAARRFDPALKESAERIAGQAMFWTADRWENVFRAAQTLKSRDLAKVFQTVS